MSISTNYQQYSAAAIESYAARDAADKYRLVEAVRGLDIHRVLDIGCGAGQDLLAFLESTDAVCFGVDMAKDLGKVIQIMPQHYRRPLFIRSNGEGLPFAENSFDVILCRVALPYMNNRKAIAEVSRVLRPKGMYLLKTHAPRFYFAMIGDRIRTGNPKLIAYPLICLAAGLWHVLTGHQMQTGFWRGKEIFQTRSYLERELQNNGLKIVGQTVDNNPQTPSYVIVKE